MKKHIALLLIIILVFTFSGCSGFIGNNRTVAVVNGEKVSFGELKYWMCSSLQYLGYDTSFESINWQETVMDAYPLYAYILYQAMDSATYYKVLETKAREMGITVNDEDKAAIKSLIDTKKENFDGEDGWKDYLKKNYLTEELFVHMMEVSFLYQNIFAFMFGENGEMISDDTALMYGNNNSYFRILRIYVGWEDEAEKDEKFKLLTRLRSELQRAEDKEALFKSYAVEYDEGGWTIKYPDGCQYKTGDLSTDIDKVTTTLGLGEVSGIESMEGGYVLIMRIPLDPDMEAVSSGEGYTLRYAAAVDSYDGIVTGWCQEADIVYKSIYYDINPSHYFPVK
jgi:foldase protein PrsA